MPEQIEWTVSNGQSGTKNAPVSSKRAKYAPKQKIKDDMSESAKAGVERWNDWWETINENNLWEDKKKR